MDISHTNSDNNNRKQYEGYKEDDCAGLGCNSKGIHRLKIIYIHRTGLFCENCKTDLKKCGLIGAD